ncbi:AAA family ATPase [Novosphingobium resinovorum]|uniref:N-acetylglucosamine-6-phosphate deacetylase n=1 Tax=Novosphingobium resinovorum TaxID=158500 RepID=A0A1D8A817_9SPHN|nr:ATP-binding protein [Novosphingobium resinovorum]AOR78238.1 N-acetylglucosamine-6-phosphate deacetylase [Novosphingobium resinovorum]
MKTVCLHGAESTGKSVLCERLLVTRGWPFVPEYGRTYCEENGTDLTMTDLLVIAEGQARHNRRALSDDDGAPVLLFDTDQLMTAAWAQMLFGEVPEALLAYPKADLYLLFEPDVPWQEDGTRFFGTADTRARFAALAEDMLVRAGVTFVRIAGTWGEREAKAVAAIEGLLAR